MCWFLYFLLLIIFNISGICFYVQVVIYVCKYTHKVRSKGFTADYVIPYLVEQYIKRNLKCNIDTASCCGLSCVEVGWVAVVGVLCLLSFLQGSSWVGPLLQANNRLYIFASIPLSLVILKLISLTLVTLLTLPPELRLLFLYSVSSSWF